MKGVGPTAGAARPVAGNVFQQAVADTQEDLAELSPLAPPSAEEPAWRFDGVVEAPRT